MLIERSDVRESKGDFVPCAVSKSIIRREERRAAISQCLLSRGLHSEGSIFTPSTADFGFK